MDEIDKFLNAPNYYAALGLNHRTCTNEQVDRAYKKYALKFHPDKNKNPKATQAFIKLGQIKETLKDTSKRNIYDDSVFHSNRSSTINYPKSSAFDEDVNAPANKPPHRKYKYPSKKRKNVFMLIGIIFLLYVLFTFIDNTEPFSDSITKESIEKIIKFSYDMDNSVDFSKYYSKMYLQPFYIPKEWEREYILSSEHDLTDQIRSYADEIFKDKLKLDCEKEKKSSSTSSHPSCIRLEDILGN